MYSGVHMNENEHTNDLYRKTHNLTQPGEQKNRHYKWPVDKHQFHFGKTEQREVDGTKKSLCNDFLDANYPITKIAKKNLEDYRQATADMVGKPKFKGTLKLTYADGFTFGVKSIVGEAWNAGKCIHGEPTRDMMVPDPDLSITFQPRSKFKSMRSSRSVDPNRIFGIPSIRSDLKVNMEKISCSDVTNYGNERDAYELLYPNIHQIIGMEQEALRVKLGKEEVIIIDINNLSSKNSLKVLITK